MTIKLIKNVNGVGAVGEKLEATYVPAKIGSNFNGADDLPVPKQYVDINCIGMGTFFDI